MSKGNILVTGGTGYIGSHCVLVLLEAGFDVTIVDNLVNSSKVSIDRVRKIVGCSSERIRTFQANLCSLDALEVVFQSSGKFDACIHFAGLKAVGESVEKPLLYYENNITGTLNLLKLMDKYNCTNLIFSSSATVYGLAKSPITEDSPVGSGITNAYGRTKYMIEEIIKDFAASKHRVKKDSVWKASILRYFNPVGSHPSGEIGEDPYGLPNNLMPFVAQVAVGRREKLTVFGNDYNTKDGTGVRDYIHVMDLVEGHLAALMRLRGENFTGFPSSVKHASGGTDEKSVQQHQYASDVPGVEVFNLGTGNGNSVLEMVEAMKKASGRPINYEFGPRRGGDIDICFADTTKAAAVLHWQASRNLDDMCKDLWNWQQKNPMGFNTTQESDGIKESK